MCGNGVVEPGETCDDGNLGILDGCLESCQAQPGYDCPALGGPCSPHCGDNRVVGGEACDDGNLIYGDGCSGSCQLEAECGNFTRDPLEDCDDGPTGGATCSSLCTLNAPLACAPLLDLSSTGTVTVDGDVTWLDAQVGGLAVAPATVEPPCGVPSLPWRFWHRFVVGLRPASLTVEFVDTALQGRNSAVWMADGCASQWTSLACGASSGPARPAHLSTPVLPAGTVVFLAVALDGDTQPTTYGLRITQRPQTWISGVTTCAEAPVLEPGIWHATASTLGEPQVPACNATGEAAVFHLMLSAPSKVTAHILSPGDATLQAWTGGCTPTTALACNVADLALDLAQDLWLRGVHPPGGEVFLVDVEAHPLLAEGAACDAHPDACAGALWCVAGLCTIPTGALYSTDFSSWDAQLVVTDGGADSQAWSACDPQQGCAQANLTGGGGAFAWVHDNATTGATEESLTLPVLDASLASGVFLALHHHVSGTGHGRVELSSDGITFRTIATVAAGENGPLSMELTPWAAGVTQLTVRLTWQRGSAGGGWQVDDLWVLPY
jgi:cysteine-rich repeat protein